MEEDEDGCSVGRDLQQAGDREVEVDVGSPRQRPHVERQPVVSEGVDEPVVVKYESLGPHVPVAEQVQDRPPPPHTGLRALDGPQFEVSRKFDVVVLRSGPEDLLRLLQPAHGEEPAGALREDPVHGDGEEAGQGGEEDQLPPVPQEEGEQSQWEPAGHPDKHRAQTDHRVPGPAYKLQHVGKKRLEDGDDEESVENSADDEGEIAGHLRGEDPRDGHPDQQRHHHRLPAVEVCQDPECEDPEDHPDEVQSLGQGGQVISAADEAELAFYRRYKVSLVEFPFITASLRAVSLIKSPFVVILPVNIIEKAARRVPRVLATEIPPFLHTEIWERGRPRTPVINLQLEVN